MKGLRKVSLNIGSNPLFCLQQLFTGLRCLDVKRHWGHPVKASMLPEAQWGSWWDVRVVEESGTMGHEFKACSWAGGSLCSLAERRA